MKKRGSFKNKKLMEVSTRGILEVDEETEVYRPKRNTFLEINIPPENNEDEEAWKRGIKNLKISLI